MSQDEKKVELRPFHETIVDAISNASGSPLLLVADLIKKTKILENYDAIAEAWKKFLRYIGHENWEKDLGVVESLMAQKAATEKEASEKVEAEAAQSRFRGSQDDSGSD